MVYASLHLEVQTVLRVLPDTSSMPNLSIFMYLRHIEMRTLRGKSWKIMETSIQNDTHVRVFWS